MNADTSTGSTIDAIDVFFQPVLALESGHICAAEMQTRWRHDENGLIDASEPVEQANADKLLHHLTPHILGKGIAGFLSFQEAFQSQDGLSDGFRLSLKLSSYELELGAFAKVLQEAFRHSSVSPNDIVLQIEVSDILEAPEISRKTLEGLSSDGVHIAIDTISDAVKVKPALKLLPFSNLNIAPNLVSGICENPSAQKTLNGIMQIARECGLSTLGKGVETVSDADFLQEHGCDFVQGLLYAKALPANDMAQLIAAWEPGEAELSFPEMLNQMAV